MSEADRLSSQIAVIEKEINRIQTDIDMKQQQSDNSINDALMRMEQAKKFDDEVKASSYEQQTTHIKQTRDSEISSMQSQLDSKKTELEQCKQKYQAELKDERTIKKRHVIIAQTLANATLADEQNS